MVGNKGTKGKIIGRLTSRNNGFGTAEPESSKMADSGFETLNEVEIAGLLNEKYRKNTKKATKAHDDQNFIYVVGIIVCCEPFAICYRTQ